MTKRMLLSVPFSFFLFSVSAFGSLSSISSDLSKSLQSKSLQGAKMSVVVKSLKTNQTIYEENGDKALNPASNTKLVTTLAALDILKPEYRFKTEYFRQGQDLVVKGYGDPSITTERLRTAAHQLRLRGVSQIEGNLVLDPSHFDSEIYAKGYEKEKNNEKAWAAPISALSLNRNAFEIFIRPTQVGKSAFVSIEPDSSYFSTNGSIRTSNKGFSPMASTRTKNGRVEVVLGGHVSENAGVKSFYRRVPDPLLYFGETLKSLLEAEGIKLKGRIVVGSVSAGVRPIFTDLSPRLSEIVNEANKYSSNFITEMLVKAIGATESTPATFSVGLQKIRSFLEEKVGFRRGEYVLGNGSGLNDANQFSANQLIRVLEYASKRFDLASEFISSLSIAGTQGTLSKRLKDPFMQRKLRGKTGTLTGVSSLSGYLAGDKDEILAFAMIFDRHQTAAWRVNQVQDEISRKLAREFRIIDNVILDSNDQDVYDESAVEEEETLQGGG